ncbi:MAG: ATP-binding cassette domain-containing protein [Eubacterium sp.]
MNELMRFDDVSKAFRLDFRKSLWALNGLNLQIFRGETLGIVGESGCGKSTLAKIASGIETPTEGSVFYNNKPLTIKKQKDRFEYATKVQMIFQNPYSTLNPRMTVGAIVSEGMEIHHLYSKEERKKRVFELFEMVGLMPEYANRFPHEFSGGQRQRIGIARALAVEPEFLICDEPISALDVSIQGQIINLLKGIQKELGLTYLFIAHNISIVKYISDRIAVLYLGHLVELAPSAELCTRPLHPYTKALMASVPVPDPNDEKERKQPILEGEIPSSVNLEVGCPFFNRCSKRLPLCSREKPTLIERSPGHFVACFSA